MTLITALFFLLAQVCVLSKKFAGEKLTAFVLNSLLTQFEGLISDLFTLISSHST